MKSQQGEWTLADTNFVVKNGLTVNTAFTANSTALYFGNTSSNVTINSTSLQIGSNVTVNTSSIQVSTVAKVGSNAYINASAVFIGNSSTNAYITSSGLYVNGTVFQSGGGYYKGSNGVVGNTNNINNIFRINANTLNANVQFSAGENASATGPLVVGDPYTITIDAGARVVIV